jgi:hypothetical protein
MTVQTILKEWQKLMVKIREVLHECRLHKKTSNQEYLITLRCKISLNNDKGIQKVKKICDVNTFTPVPRAGHLPVVGHYHTVTR